MGEEKEAGTAEASLRPMVRQPAPGNWPHSTGPWAPIAYIERPQSEPGVPMPRRLLALCLALALAAVAEPVRAESPVHTYYALSLLGEPKYPADFKHFDFVNPDAPKGGEIKRAAIGSFDSFNPFIVKGDPAEGIGALFETLMTQSPDEPDTAYGLLAQSVEIPEDRSWVAFDLRPEARFQDGTPVTAEDVVFTFNILTTKGDPQYALYYAGVSKVEAVGPLK